MASDDANDYLGPPSQPATAWHAQQASHFSDSSLDEPMLLQQPEPQLDLPVEFDPTQPPTQSRPSQSQPSQALPPEERPWLILTRDFVRPDTLDFLQVRKLPHETTLRIGRYAGRRGPGADPPDNDIIVHGDTVHSISNYHCRIELLSHDVGASGAAQGSVAWDGDDGPPPAARQARHTVVLTSLGGQSTFVNNTRLVAGETQALRTGDQISLGYDHTRKQRYGYVPRRDWVWNVFIPRYEDQDETAGADPPEEQEFRNRYTILDELGHGSFATVFRCYDRSEGAVRAMKQIDKRKFATAQQAQNINNFRREIAILQQVDHPNIVKYYDHLETDRFIFIVMELLDGGDLLEYIISNGGLSEHATRIIIAGLMQALAYLETMHTAHRDLKPENIMVTSGANPVPKIVDFGLAKMLIDPEDRFTTQCGTPAYLAPEVVVSRLKDQQGAYSVSCDVFSLAVICFAALTNATAFDGDGPNIRVMCETRKIDIDRLLGHRPDLSADCVDFITRTGQQDPRDRMTARQALQHWWIRPFTTVEPNLHSFADLPVNNSQDSQRRPASQQHPGSQQRTESQPFALSPASPQQPRWYDDPVDDEVDMGPSRSPGQESEGSELGDLRDDEMRKTATEAAEVDQDDTLDETPPEEDFSQEMRKMHIRTPARQSFGAGDSTVRDVDMTTPTAPEARPVVGDTGISPAASGPSAPPSGLSDNGAEHPREESAGSSASSRKRPMRRNSSSLVMESDTASPLAPALPATPAVQGGRKTKATPSTGVAAPPASVQRRESRRQRGQAPEVAPLPTLGSAVKKSSRSSKATATSSTPDGPTAAKKARKSS